MYFSIKARHSHKEKTTKRSLSNIVAANIIEGEFFRLKQSKFTLQQTQWLRLKKYII